MQGFRADIEGLRGVAVLLIVAFHAKVPGVTGGFVGVDVFFVLSGYLITSLLVREIEGTGRIDLRQFYGRRARRLLPAFLVVLVATLSVGSFIYSPLEIARYAHAAVATSLYVSNFWFIREAADYFAPETDVNPFLHTWSLAVEEQFYLIWPLLLSVPFFRRSASEKRTRYLLGLCFLSFALCVWLTGWRQPWAFFASPARAWEFGAGALASFLPRLPGLALAGWAGLAAIFASAFEFSSHTGFPGYAALGPVVGAILVLWAGAHGAQPWGLARGVLPRLGKLSYSWYLWHWPVLLLAEAASPGMFWEMKLACTLFALLLAEVTYRFVENPVRLHPRLVAKPRLSLALAVVVPAVGAAMSLGFYFKAKRAAASPEQLRLAAAAVDRSRLGKDGCITEFAEAKLRECAAGAPGAKVHIVLFGDSHADQWFPALEKLALEKSWRITTLIKSSCATARVPIFNPRIRRVERECEIWRESALDRIVELEPTLVVMANASGYVEGPGREGGYSTLSPAQWQEGMRSTLEYLDEEGVATVLLADTPRAGFDVPTCLSRAAAHGRKPSACGLDRSLALDAALFEAERAAARGLARVKHVDLSERLCAGKICPALLDGDVAYSDTNHLSAGISRRLSEALLEQIGGLAR